MTPDKRVELVEQFKKGNITTSDEFSQALTQYHQDMMSEVAWNIEKERKPLIHDVNWAEGYNAGLTKAQNIIKQLLESK